jgi:hypothetical protein
MRRKKPPYVLISILLLMGGFMAAWNMLSSGTVKLPAPKPQMPAPQPMATTSEDLKAQYKKGKQPEQAAPGSVNVGPTKPRGTREDMESARPAPSNQKYVPKPSETSTSSQWY